MLNEKTGHVEKSFHTVPNGCIGGGQWSSVAVDATAGTIYFGSGNPDLVNGCKEPMAPAIIELKAANLQLVGHWTVPAQAQSSDSDFGATPSLFSDGHGTKLVGLSNKNGTYYVFRRDHLGAGPVWKRQVSDTFTDIPLAASAYDGSSIYVMGGQETINGSTCSQNLSKLNPANGSVLWQVCTAGGPALGVVSMVPGVVVIGSHSDMQVYSAKSGALLYSFVDPSSNSIFWGSGSIADGMIFFGNRDGNLGPFRTQRHQLRRYPDPRPGPGLGN